MNDPLQALLNAAPSRAATLPPNSRYRTVGTTTLLDASGETIVYFRRRFLPPPERLAVLQEYAVVDGDRMDNLAARFFDDPELWWRLADANRVMRPEELTETPGRQLRITLPDGTPGASNV
jgi:hypothetical protein